MAVGGKLSEQLAAAARRRKEMQGAQAPSSPSTPASIAGVTKDIIKSVIADLNSDRDKMPEPNLVPPSQQENDDKVYFKSSTETLAFFYGDDNRRASFKNYFLITDDPEIIAHVRANLIHRKMHFIVEEVPRSVYIASTTIVPTIEPLPIIEESEPNNTE